MRKRSNQNHHKAPTCVGWKPRCFALLKEHIGSCLDDFLENEDLLAETEAAATKRVIAWQVEQSSFPTC